MTGLHLSHYRIDTELGRGGMGVVYRAFDTKLDRMVAIKVLPSKALATADDRARFFREAKAAAALHHPNIATVFGIDEAAPAGDGAGSEPRLFIAMEYIDGETLSERIKRGPLKLDEAVGIASQIAEALKAAHGKDIVHRDIKSANVMLSSDGVAKVLDFGLAKTQASTMLTQLGSTLGTVAYMSPEQARGEEVDRRTDLYSLGVVLYEMIAGRLPFSGRYEQAVVYTILHEDAEPLTTLRTGVPMGLEAVVAKCLRKSPDLRYQSAADLGADLKSQKTSALSPQGPSSAATGTRRPRPAWWMVVTALVLGAAMMQLVPNRSGPLSDRPVVAFSLPWGEEETRSMAIYQTVAIAPDGKSIAYAANGQIVVRHMNALETPIPLVGTEGGISPTFSPDGQSIAFHRPWGRSIYQVRISGGAAELITQLPAVTRGLHWDEEGMLYFDQGRLIGRIRASGGEPEILVDRPGLSYAPMPLPDDRLLYSHVESDASAETSTARLLDLDTGKDVVLVENAQGARWLDTGHLVFVRNSALYAVGFDLSSGSPVGSAVPVVEDVSAAPEAAHFDISREGTLVKIPGTVPARRLTLSWIDALGESRPLQNLPRRFDRPRFDPNGQVVAVAIEEENRQDMWLIDAADGTDRRLASEGGRASLPAWSPEGDLLAYVVAEPLRRSLLVRSPNTPAIPDTLVTFADDLHWVASSWSPDGTQIAVFNESTSGPGDIVFVDVATGDLQTFLATSADEDYPEFSPSGDWIAYESDQLGSNEVFVRRLPDGQSIQVSRSGMKPHWGDTDSELYFRDTEGAVVLVEFDPMTGAASAPRRETPVGAVELLGVYDVQPKTGHLLARKNPDTIPAELASPQFDFVINFHDRLRRLVLTN